MKKRIIKPTNQEDHKQTSKQCALAVHCWIHIVFFRIPTVNLSYRFPILKLPPPPCAVLLVTYPLFFNMKITYHPKQIYNDSIQYKNDHIHQHINTINISVPYRYVYICICIYSCIHRVIPCLVGGFNPSEKFASQLELFFPINGKQFPNHQPMYVVPVVNHHVTSF